MFQSEKIYPANANNPTHFEVDFTLTDRAVQILMNPRERGVTFEVARIVVDKLNKIVSVSERLKAKNPWGHMTPDILGVFDVTDPMDYSMSGNTFGGINNAWCDVKFIPPNIVKLTTSDSINLGREKPTPEISDLTITLFKKSIIEAVNEIEQLTPEALKLQVKTIPSPYDYETIIIPKGTLFFRSIRTADEFTHIFLGTNTKRKPNDFCMSMNHRSYFYPYPFVSDVVSKYYEYVVMFVTTRDMKLINQMNSKNSYWKPGKSVIRIDKLPGCHYKNPDENADNYEPAINYDIVSSDVNGIVGIHGQDGETLLEQKSKFLPYFNKYFTTFTDSAGKIGLPELVLNPRQFPPIKQPTNIVETIYKRLEYMEIHGPDVLATIEIKEKVDDFKPWYTQNKSKLNFIYLHVMKNDPPAIQNMMDDFLSKGGLDLGDDEPYHLKMNKKNGLFQIVEFSNNHADLIYPDFSVQTTEFIRKDIYPLSTTGASRPLRRTTLRRRLLKSR